MTELSVQRWTRHAAIFDGKCALRLFATSWTAAIASTGSPINLEFLPLWVHPSMREIEVI